MAAARPLVGVHKQATPDKVDNADQILLPSVFLTPIRPDIVHFVHTNMAKNRRQAYAVKEEAGHQHSAESWGTGRAVARIPRVSGGGTSRAGQGAFGNQCRKGRMFAPTKQWRRWHRKINTNQKRFAVASALAASALPALVMARGHRIDQVPEVPLVVDNAAQAIQKTKDAVALLKAFGADADYEKAKLSRKIRRGTGKMRNRRYVMRRGPLVVYSEDQGVAKAFRNLPGVETCHVDRLNLLQLAPGGHIGRFIIWTRGAFERLNSVFGTVSQESKLKTGYTLPRPIMFNSDITRIINSQEIQSQLKPANFSVRRYRMKKNPLTNLGVKVRLNPYALVLRRSELLADERRAKAKAERLATLRAGKPVHMDLTEAKKVAAAKTHEPMQKVNYKRLVDDTYFGKPRAQKQLKIVAVTTEKGQPKQFVGKGAPKAAAKPAAKPAAKAGAKASPKAAPATKSPVQKPAAAPKSPAQKPAAPAKTASPKAAPKEEPKKVQKSPAAKPAAAPAAAPAKTASPKTSPKPEPKKEAKKELAKPEEKKPAKSPSTKPAAEPAKKSPAQEPKKSPAADPKAAKPKEEKAKGKK